MSSNSKPKNYLKYAIGEILLVMIGILAAFQINSWNGEVQNRKKERLMLDALNKEFIQNKVQFDTVFSYHKRNFASITYLKNQLPIDLKKVDLDSLAYHIWNGSSYWTFNPFQGVTNSLINTASFDLIRNQELRTLLISWNDLVVDYQEDELTAKNSYLQDLKQFEKANFNWAPDYRMLLSDPRVDLSVLTTLAFDNYVYDRYIQLFDIVRSAAGEADSVRSYVDRIIALSAPGKD